MDSEMNMMQLWFCHERMMMTVNSCIPDSCSCACLCTSWVGRDVHVWLWWGDGLYDGGGWGDGLNDGGGWGTG